MRYIELLLSLQSNKKKERKYKVMKTYQINFNNGLSPLFVNSEEPLMDDDVINLALKNKLFSSVDDINYILNVIEIE